MIGLDKEKNKYEMRIVVEAKSKKMFLVFLCNESRYGRKGNHNQQLN
ncbi:hypothetical protein JG559_13670 [Enterococcus faecalis]|uniref:Uncharacterized protein n=1 Tax=Enterococcus faecalis TaxID=1351 RepID=A0A974NZM0_ENTFL|nr:hypothetical protein JG559_13670 [Enterococcus faecalis]